MLLQSVYSPGGVTRVPEDSRLASVKSTTAVELIDGPEDTWWIVLAEGCRLCLRGLGGVFLISFERAGS